MNGIISLNIDGREDQLPVREINGERVITAMDIARLHKKDVREVNQAFKRHVSHLVRDEDYFVVTREEAKITDCDFEDLFVSPRQSEVYLFTESGYLMLVKSFTDDLAWKVQRHLVSSYFRARNMMRPLSPAEAFMEQAKIMLIHERKLKELEDKTMRLEKTVEQVSESNKAAVEDLASMVKETVNDAAALRKRVDCLDGINISGDPRQQLVQLVRSYALKKGYSYAQAWGLFRRAYNTAFKTNIKRKATNHAKRYGLEKISLPEFLLETGLIYDALRVADKLVNVGWQAACSVASPKAPIRKAPF